MKKFKKLAGLGLLAWSLSACTLWHQPDYVLPDKDTLRAGEDITVQPNENVYAIARKHNVSMREIIVLNNLQPPFALHSGQHLTLPLKEGDVAKAPESAPLAAIQAVPLELQAKPAPVQLLPNNSSGVSAPQSLPPTQTAPATITPTEVPKAEASAAAVAETNTASITDSNKTSLPPLSVVPPVQGPILSGFGSKSQGMSNDGINIGAPKGAPVVASAGGIVVYAGSEMKGFGNLILVRHEGGWVTAYAHLDRMLVGKDTIVASGDQIGTVGQTGGVTSPQLHFETRLEGKPVDPQILLKRVN